jgi:peptidoglycan/xylan/chitin deacetylase (PgdA/CDA1 family)
MTTAQVPILTFHKVDPAFEWGVTRVTPTLFIKLITFLKNEGYTSITLSQLFDSDATLPNKPIVLTFDDSYESVYTYAYPIMESVQFIGTIFIITGYVGKFNSWDVNLGGKQFRHMNWMQIKQLADAGFEVGSHSVHHKDLTYLNASTLQSEVEQSKTIIEDKIGSSVQFISFPFGRFNRNIIDICKQVGYERGCGLWISSKIKSTEPFVLKRQSFYLFDNIHNLKGKIENRFLKRIEDLKLRVVNFCSYGTTLVKSFRPGDGIRSIH